MKRKWLRFGGIVVLVLIAYQANVLLQTKMGNTALKESGMPFHEFEEAQQLAIKNDKAVLVYVSAIWCPNCRSFDKKVWSDKLFQSQVLEKYVVARMEYEDETTQRFLDEQEVSGFPRLFLKAGDGSFQLVNMKRDATQMAKELGLES